MQGELSKQQSTKKSYLPEKIPITYLWYGKSIPEDYLISLSDLKFPVVFLKNPKIKRTFKRQIMDVQKSDYYRLQYLQQFGGIYSDLDNVIDHPCLMELLKPYRDQDKVIFQSVGRHTRQKLRQMTNGLIFAPRPHLPLMKRLVDQVNESKKKIWDFAGLTYLAKFKEPVELDMTKCVVHTGDWSWFEASNQVLKRNTAPHEKFTKKLKRKQEFLVHQQQLKKELQRVKQDNKKLITSMNELLKQNKDFIQQLKNKNLNPPKETKNNTGNKDSHQNNLSAQSSPVNIKQQMIHSWQREKQAIQDYIDELEQENRNLMQQKQMLDFSIFGALFMLLLVGVMFCVLVRSRRNKRIDNIQTGEQVESQKTTVSM